MREEFRLDGVFCRVCGYENDEPPWGRDGRMATFDICPCCNVEWGYEDSSPASAAKYRAGWLARGAVWSDRHTLSDGLTAAERLSRAMPG